jgi:hypothetical protein
MMTRIVGSRLLKGVLLAGLVFATTAHAGSLGGTAEENKQAIDACKLPAQQVTYVVDASRPIAPDAPATADEEKRVRNVMAAAGVVYDRVNRRAIFEMVLGLVRANGIIRFQILPSDGSVEFDNTKNCLTGLANDIGVAAEFESIADSPRGTDGTKASG